MKLTLRQLGYFVAAGETGSITHASRRANISQPAISAAISQLEAELGAQLFLRHHAQGLSLTPAGRELLKEAKQLLKQAEGLYSAAAALGNLPRGELNVGWFTTLAPIVMPELLQSFIAAYPEARIRTKVSHQEDLLDSLHHATVDIAVTYDLQLTPDVSFRPLASLPPHVLVGAEHPLATRKSITLAELAPLPMVLLDLPLSREYFLPCSSARSSSRTWRGRRRTRRSCAPWSQTVSAMRWLTSGRAPIPHSTVGHCAGSCSRARHDPCVSGWFHCRGRKRPAWSRRSNCTARTQSRRKSCPGWSPSSSRARPSDPGAARKSPDARGPPAWR